MINSGGERKPPPFTCASGFSQCADGGGASGIVVCWENASEVYKRPQRWNSDRQPRDSQQTSDPGLVESQDNDERE